MLLADYVIQSDDESNSTYMSKNSSIVIPASRKMARNVPSAMIFTMAR